MKQTNNNKFYDSSNILSIDLQSRKLYNSSGTEVFNWTSGGGASDAPTARYIYLVQDSSDVTKMGGSTERVYSTFSAAYDAANTLQVALGGTNKVIIRIGNITAAVAGNLTLTSDWNPHVWMEGINSEVSIVGNITLSNASGNGRNIGTNPSSLFVSFSDLKVGNIVADATGTSGNGGSIYIRWINCKAGNLTSALGNSSNSTGSSGAIYMVNSVGSFFGIISNRIANSTSAGATGELQIGSSFGMIYINSIGHAITNNPGATQGVIRIVNTFSDGPIRIGTQGGVIFMNNLVMGDPSGVTEKLIAIGSTNDLASDLDVVIKNVTTNQYPSVGETSENILKVDVQIVVGTDHASGNMNVELLNIDGGNLYIENSNNVIVKNSNWRNTASESVVLFNAETVRLHNCVIEQIDLGSAAISLSDSGVAFDLTLLHCSVYGGTFAIDANGTTDVHTGSSYFQTGVSGNISLAVLTLDA